MCKVTLVRFEASVMIRKTKNRHFFTFPRYLWAPWSTNPGIIGSGMIRGNEIFNLQGH